MDLKARKDEIELCQILLGKYTALIMRLYEDKAMPPDNYRDSLIYIRDKLIQLKGIDDEDVLILQEQIDNI